MSAVEKVVELDADIHKALKLYSVQTGQSMRLLASGVLRSWLLAVYPQGFEVDLLARQGQTPDDLTAKAGTEALNAVSRF